MGRIDPANDTGRESGVAITCMTSIAIDLLVKHGKCLVRDDDDVAFNRTGDIGHTRNAVSSDSC